MTTSTAIRKPWISPLDELVVQLLGNEGPAATFARWLAQRRVGHASCDTGEQVMVYVARQPDAAHEQLLTHLWREVPPIGLGAMTRAACDRLNAAASR